ncbi:MAG: alpha-hydroxy acid oxidase [Alsobacter sp.]
MTKVSPDRPRALRGIASLDEMRLLAKRRLPRMLFEYIDRGTERERALSADRAAYDALRLLPSQLVDVSARSAACTVLGRAQAMPVIVAPTEGVGLVWYRGEVELARAAADAGIPVALATRSLASVETVVREAGGDVWFQLYASTDIERSRALLARATAAGVRVLVVTVDTPIPARRDYNIRNGFSIPFKPTVRALTDMTLHPRWLLGVIGQHMRDGGLPRLENLPERPLITEGSPPAAMLNGALTWAHLRVLRDLWPGAFVVKGLLTVDDARQAVDVGADAIVVSNHGARNFDSAPSPVAVLPGIAAAVGTKIEVLVDGGIRHGSDIAKALALGARAVLVGRPTLYGTAVAGRDGAALALAILREELLYTMAMLGRSTVAGIGPDVLYAQDGRARPAFRLPAPGRD